MNRQIELAEELKSIPKILRKAYSKIITPYLMEGQGQTHLKGENDLVTDCDIAVEKYIIDEIKALFPEDHIISEETNGGNQLEGRTWIIDPIDGTVNFAKGIPLFGLQVALVIDSEPYYAAIYLPFSGEMFTAMKDQGAFVNGQPLEVSKVTKLKESLVSFGDFTSRANGEKTRANQIATVQNIHDNIRKLKMFGSSSVDFAFLAAGKTDAHVIFTRNLWDLIPGYFIATQAGGVSNYSLKEPVECIAVAANQELLDQLLEKVVY